MSQPKASTSVVGIAATALSATGPPRVVKVSVPASTVPVYVGSSAVTVAAGYPVAAGNTDSFVVEDGGGLYGIVQTTTTTVNVYVSVS